MGTLVATDPTGRTGLMSGWTDGLALALGVPALTEEQTTMLLQASREVAHRVERRETPLSTYLAGVAAGLRLRGGRRAG